MDVLILRLLLDASFFMAVFNPLVSSSNYVIRWGLCTVLAVWLGWILINWKKKDLAGRIQDVAFSELKILAVVQVYELVILGFANWQEKSAPYVACFAVIMILFLRAGRLVGGSQEKKRFWGANSIEVCAVLGVTVLMSSEAVKALGWKILGGIYMKLIFPILMLLIRLFQAVLMFLEPFISALFSGSELPEFEMEIDNRTAQDFLDLTGMETLRETPVWVKIVGLAIVSVIGAIVFYFLYQKLSVAGSGRDRTIRGEVKKSSIGVSDRPVSKRRSFFEEKNVRHYYRRFLELCRKHGLEPETPQVTSEMMQQIAVEHWGEERVVGELTDLYREVRYGGRKDEEPERKVAKTLFKRMKSVAEEKKRAQKS